MKLIFATHNKHKLEEARAIAGACFNIEGLTELGFHEDIPETADTLKGNALQKARFVFERFHTDCFADDTGLEIAALDGRPGVYSARYAGEHCTYEDNVRKVLSEMEGLTQREACFKTVIALILNGQEYFFEGRGDYHRKQRHQRLWLRSHLPPPLLPAHLRRTERRREKCHQPPRSRHAKTDGIPQKPLPITL